MKKLNQLLRYHFISYFKTARIIMPLVVWVVFLGSAYYVMPQDVVGSFSMSSVFLFIIMIWVAMSYMESIHPIEEQLFLLKVKNEQTYYWSKTLFVYFIGSLFVGLGFLFPLFVNLINGFKLFARPLVPFDYISLLILHMLAAILGGTIGICLQPRCVKDRKLALLLATIIAVFSLVKASIVKGALWTKIVFVFIPPITDIITPFSSKPFFNIVGIIFAILYVGIYSLILLLINQYMLKKKTF